MTIESKGFAEKVLIAIQMNKSMEETRKTIQKMLNHDEILKRVQLAMLRQKTVTYASNKRILQRRTLPPFLSG